MKPGILVRTIGTTDVSRRMLNASPQLAVHSKRRVLLTLASLIIPKIESPQTALVAFDSPSVRGEIPTNHISTDRLSQIYFVCGDNTTEFIEQSMVTLLN